MRYNINKKKKRVEFKKPSYVVLYVFKRFNYEFI